MKHFLLTLFTLAMAAPLFAQEITNGVTTVKWNADAKKVEIADEKGVYATVPFGDFEKIVPPQFKEVLEDFHFLTVECQDRSQTTFFITKPDSRQERLRCYCNGVGIVKFNMGSKTETIRFEPIDLHLPKKVDQLKSFGTAGLKAVDGHKGSYMFLAVADPETRSGVVSGWGSAATGSGIVYSEKTAEGGARIIPELQYGSERKNLLLTEMFVLARCDDCLDGLEYYADFIAMAAKIELKPIPAGYCTWYSNKYGGASNAEGIKLLAEDAKKKLEPFGMNFVQIDDKWQLGVKSNGPKKNFTGVDPQGPYPDGMKPSVDLLNKDGFVAGLWFMPFSGTVEDSHYPKEWFVKSGRTDEVNAQGKSKRRYNSVVNKKGEPYESFWGGTSLDMTKPEVQKYLGENVKRMYDEWGFRYFKLDGLWTGMACDQLYVNNEYMPEDFGEAVFADPTQTPIQAYCKGLDIVRENAPDAFILGCNVSQNMRMMAPSVGKVDAMRIGPDNGAKWEPLTRGPWHGSNRYFMNGRLWWNDPDPVYVRDSMPVEHARLIATWVSISGQLFAFSDWLPELSEERVEILRRTIAPHGLKTVRPVDLFEADLPRIWHLWDEKDGVRRDVLAFYNWDDKNPTTIKWNPYDFGIAPGMTMNGVLPHFVVFDYWNNKMFGSTLGEALDVELPPGACKVLAVRHVPSMAIGVLSTSRHVSQGIVDLSNEKWDSNTDTLSGTSKVVANDPYELRIYLPTVYPDSHTVDKIDVSAGTAEWAFDDAEWKKVNGGRLLRVTLKSDASADIRWSVRFKNK